MKYYIVNNNIYWKDPIGVILNCIIEEGSNNILDQHHNVVCGGHFVWKATTHKILSDFSQPVLFSEVNMKVGACVKCKMFSRKQKISSFTLKQI